MSESRKAMTVEQAMLALRDDPEHAERMRAGYLGPDLQDNAERFERSGEFAEVRRLLGDRLRGATVLDLGAGNGIASYALARAGAGRVYALEPDPSGEIGHGAIRRLCAGLPVEILEAVGEQIPLGSGCVDILYVRQVLHHIYDLPKAMTEFARVLKPGGVMIASRDHVVDDEAQMRLFLASHPVHQLAGNEHAHTLHEYTSAITGAGLRLERIFAPYESILNAFPVCSTQAEVDALPRRLLREKLGGLGTLLGAIPPVRNSVRRELSRRAGAGRMYSFLAVKPP